MHKILAILFPALLLWAASAAWAQPVALWPDTSAYAATPYSERAQLFPYVLDTEKKRPAVLICPGGGYTHLAMEKEGHRFARWFNKQGMHAFVLKYRVDYKSNGRHTLPYPFMDAAKALKLLHQKAHLWKIDTTKTGIMGFSAGGHLASAVGTHFNTPWPDTLAQWKFAYPKPDFMALIYPVITFKAPYVHKGSRYHLLGEAHYENPELIRHFSSHLQVDSLTPPTFLVHAHDDQAVPPSNSLLFYQALKKHQVPAEMHIYQYGGHGFGMAKNRGTLARWPLLLKQWLQKNDILNN